MYCLTQSPQTFDPLLSLDPASPSVRFQQTIAFLYFLLRLFTRTSFSARNPLSLVFKVQNYPLFFGTAEYILAQKGRGFKPNYFDE